MPFVSLVSTPFSGSTLLALLMDAHPEVASIGELSNAVGALFQSGRIERYLCSCGVQIEHCPFWRGVQELCAEQGIELDLHDFGTELDSGLGHRVNQVLFGALGDLWPLQVFLNRILGFAPGYRLRIERVVNRNLVIAQAVCNGMRKRIFFDASKKVGHATLLQRRSDLDFKLVHLVRDPRGVVNSNRKHRGRRASQRSAHSWSRVHVDARRLGLSLAQDAYLLVRYEDLCTNPEETLGEICRFLDIETLDLVSAAQERPHHLIGNQMRLRAFTGLRLDEAWRRDLTPAEISRCMQATGSVVEDLGLGYG
ncbi:sulfotransferase [Chloroflexota bacterium]